ncbi:hypothetical protein AABB02_01255 [Streptomyces rimosus]|uniref:hypothetical protein n=1 Tax=Streptomyces rimosus TaxID=1927 RepID=UPI0031E45759
MAAAVADALAICDAVGTRWREREQTGHGPAETATMHSDSYRLPLRAAGMLLRTTHPMPPLVEETFRQWAAEARHDLDPRPYPLATLVDVQTRIVTGAARLR